MCCNFVVSPSVNKQSSWQPVLSSGLRHHTHDNLYYLEKVDRFDVNLCSSFRPSDADMRQRNYHHWLRY